MQISYSITCFVLCACVCDFTSIIAISLCFGGLSAAHPLNVFPSISTSVLSFPLHSAYSLPHPCSDLTILHVYS